MPVGFFQDRTYALVFGRGDLAVSPVALESNPDTKSVLMIELADSPLEIGSEGAPDEVCYDRVAAICFENPQSVDVMIKNLQKIREDLTCCNLSKCKIDITEIPESTRKEWTKDAEQIMSELVISEVFNLLDSRKGFDYWFDNLDPDIRQEILDAAVERVQNVAQTGVLSFKQGKYPARTVFEKLADDIAYEQEEE